MLDCRPIGSPFRTALVLLLANAAAAQGLTLGIELPPQDVHFDRDIRPLLARNCFACHGPDPGHREEELRLDTRAGATGERDGVAAIVPGILGESELWARINDARHPMPPHESGHSLSPEDKSLIGRWIEAGAEYTPHWSLVPVERPLPESSLGGQSVQPIDYFVGERLSREGLQPGPQADRATLARRLALDLTGLPADPDRLAAFLQDSRPEAYGLFVDELLASPHYGEHWAAMWLDLARYADSKGYGSDPLRTIWRWRDWVIAAFDQNMPLDRFAELQMAGDLLPEATWETQLATAFHRNTMVNTEGGTDDEEFRVAAVKDRVNTTAQVWLGMTMGCAQCHSHKFDPISHEEYYSFFALFNQTADRDANDDSPRIQTPTQAELLALRDLDAQLAAIDKELDTTRLESPSDFEAWVSRQQAWRNPREYPDPMTTAAGSRLPHAWPEGYANLAHQVPERDIYPLRIGPLENPTALLLRAVAQAGLPGGGPGLSPDNGNFVLSELRAIARPRELSLVNGRFVRVQHRGANRILSLAEVQVFDRGENVARAGLASQSSVDYGGPPQLALDGDSDGVFEHGSVTHSRTESDPWWEVDLGAVHTIDSITLWNRVDGTLARRLRGATLQVLDGNRRVTWQSEIDVVGSSPTSLVPLEGERLRLVPLSASFEQEGWPLAHSVDDDRKSGWAIGPRAGESHEAVYGLEHTPTWPFDLELELVQDFGDQHLLGAFQVQFTSSAQAPQALPHAARELLGREPAQWSDSERAMLEGLARQDDPRLRELHDEERRLQGLRDKQMVTETPVLVALAAEEQRETHVLLKGNFLSLGPEVQAGVPECISGETKVTNRLELAHWLTSRENPLTARVHVNRLWARLFGKGLVETEEDFGAQGMQPTHPHLLDWLAVELMESGWDQQHILRTIVKSATYRQSSHVTQASLLRDPSNLWLSRGPRFRLSAEQVRDQALAISGLLSPKKFGPSVFPPQPDGLWQAAFNGTDRTWETSLGEDRYRRAVYVFLRRSSPYPSLQVFDAPTRESCTPRRIRTNTPLQAFVTLNDPVFVECAQAFAQRILHGAARDDSARAAFGLELALQRTPRAEEIATIAALVQGEREYFDSHLENAAKLAGLPFGSDIEQNETVSLAAWTTAANVILNLDEVLTKQ